jgi:hypothetical protein
MRTDDHGRTFKTFDRLKAGPDDYRPVGLATDGKDALFAVCPEIGASDTLDGYNWFLRRYDVGDEVTRLIFEQDMGPGGTNNYCLLYDRRRELLHYTTIVGSTPERKRDNLISSNPTTGEIVAARALTISPDGRDGYHYPHFAMQDGTIFLAWTSWEQQRQIYDGIAIIQSDDGGATWTRLDGAPITLPIDGRPSGPAERLVTSNDLGVSTWLANMVCHGNALHLFYCARAQPKWRQTYLRHDLHDRRWDYITPRWGGETMEINGIDGFFLSAGERLFAIGNQSGSAIAVLVSVDAGQSWQDFGLARMPEGFFPFGLHGCLTSDGALLGLFTANPLSGAGRCKVMSFRIELSE